MFEARFLGQVPIAGLAQAKTRRPPGAEAEQYCDPTVQDCPPSSAEMGVRHRYLAQAPMSKDERDHFLADMARAESEQQEVKVWVDRQPKAAVLQCQVVVAKATPQLLPFSKLPYSTAPPCPYYDKWSAFSSWLPELKKIRERLSGDPSSWVLPAGLDKAIQGMDEAYAAFKTNPNSLISSGALPTALPGTPMPAPPPPSAAPTGIPTVPLIVGGGIAAAGATALLTLAGPRMVPIARFMLGQGELESLEKKCEELFRKIPSKASYFEGKGPYWSLDRSSREYQDWQQCLFMVAILRRQLKETPAVPPVPVTPVTPVPPPQAPTTRPPIRIPELGPIPFAQVGPSSETERPVAMTGNACYSCGGQAVWGPGGPGCFLTGQDEATCRAMMHGGVPSMPGGLAPTATALTTPTSFGPGLTGRIPLVRGLGTRVFER